MSAARQRAPRFELPLGDDAAGGGLATDARGGLAMVEGDAAVRQALRLLLATTPGERVMRPHYGCDVRRLLFAPADATTAGLAVHLVRRAVERWEPRVELLDVAVELDHEGGALVLRVAYRVRATGRQDAVDLALDLGGTA